MKAQTEMQVWGRLIRAMALAALLAAVPRAGLAQGVSDFRLPTPSASPSSRVQGPVDPDNPVTTAPRPAPRPTQAPPPISTTPPPSATVTPGTGPAATRAPDAARRPPLPRAVSGRSAPTRVAPGSGPELPSAAEAPPPASIPVPSDAPIFSTQPGAPSAPTLVPPASAAWPAWLPFAAAALAGLIAAAAGLAMWQRRRAEAPIEIDFERPLVLVTTLVAPDAPGFETVAATPPLIAPEPIADQTASGLTIALEARRMSASLMATTLSYRLVLTNHGDTTLNALAIEGDMIAAHGQLPPEQQVANRTQKLELRHALVALAPGETAEFIGDIRVPLELLSPIRAGSAAYFVPLARFRVEAGAVVVAQTFVVGEAPDQPGAALRPFRLDLGPRTYSKIGQRAVG